MEDLVNIEKLLKPENDNALLNTQSNSSHSMTNIKDSTASRVEESDNMFKNEQIVASVSEHSNESNITKEQSTEEMEISGKTSGDTAVKETKPVSDTFLEGQSNKEVTKEVRPEEMYVSKGIQPVEPEYHTSIESKSSVESVTCIENESGDKLTVDSKAKLTNEDTIPTAKQQITDIVVLEQTENNTVSVVEQSSREVSFTKAESTKSDISTEIVPIVAGVTSTEGALSVLATLSVEQQPVKEVTFSTTVGSTKPVLSTTQQFDGVSISELTPLTESVGHTKAATTVSDIVTTEAEGTDGGTISREIQLAKEVITSVEVEQPESTIISATEQTPKETIIFTKSESSDRDSHSTVVVPTVTGVPSAVNERTEMAIVSTVQQTNEVTVSTIVESTPKIIFATEAQPLQEVTISSELEPIEEGNVHTERIPTVADIATPETEQTNVITGPTVEQPANQVEVLKEVELTNQVTFSTEGSISKNSASTEADSTTEISVCTEAKSIENITEEIVKNNDDGLNTGIRDDINNYTLPTDEAIPSTSLSLVDESDSCISALMKLAEIACRDEFNDLGISNASPSSNVSNMNIVSSGNSSIKVNEPGNVNIASSGVLSIKIDEPGNVKDANNLSPSISDSVSNEPVLGSCEVKTDETNTAEEDSNIMSIKSEVTESCVQLTEADMENNISLDGLGIMKECGDQSIPMELSNSPDANFRVSFMDSVCMKCRTLWNDKILMLLFEGTEPVAVHSSITFGALLCMRKYAHNNNLPVDDAVKLVLDSADFGKQLGSTSVTTVCKWIRKLIIRKKIKCCDKFCPVSEPIKNSSNSSSLEVIEDDNTTRKRKYTFTETSDKTVQNKTPDVSEMTHSRTLSYKTKATADTERTSNEIVPDEGRDFKIESVIETPKIMNYLDDPIHKLFKLISPFKSNGDYLNRGSMNVKLYLSKERKCMPKQTQSIYDSLYFNLKYFTEIDGSYYRKTTCNELIVCCFMSFDINEDIYNKKLLCVLISNLLRLRGKVLLIPNEDDVFNYIMNLAREILSSDSVADEVWDKNEIYSADINRKEVEVITIRDVVVNFCCDREDLNIVDFKSSLCKRLKSLNVDDIVGYSLRIYATYCDIAFNMQEESKARFLLNLPTHSNGGDSIINADLNIFPPTRASTLDAYKGHYQHKLSCNFDYASLSQENQDILLEASSSCKDNILKFADDENIGKALLSYVEENTQRVGTKRQKCDELEFSRPVKSVKLEKLDRNLLRDVISCLSHDNIKASDVPRIVGIIYREIYKLDTPSLSEIQEALMNC